MHAVRKLTSATVLFSLVFILFHCLVSVIVGYFNWLVYKPASLATELHTSSKTKHFKHTMQFCRSSFHFGKFVCISGSDLTASKLIRALLPLARHHKLLMKDKSSLYSL